MPSEKIKLTYSCKSLILSTSSTIILFLTLILAAQTTS